MHVSRLIPALVLFSAVSTSALAGVITVTDSPTGRTGFGGNDLVSWSSLGPTMTPASNPFSITSTSGVSVTLSEATGNFQRRDLGNGWNGNFTDGSALLWTGGNNGGVSITFGTLIQGIGFQINPDNQDSGTTVSVYGAGNVLFQTFNLATNNRGASSADFIGFTSSLNDIARITITQNVSSDFAFNELSLIDGISQVVSVPEPETVALLALGLFGMALRRRARR